MRHLTVLLALFALPGTALAQCPTGAETLIACTLKGGTKRVETCLMGESALYRFGPVGGTPELELSAHIRDVGMTPWPGVSRSIWEAVIFYNRDISYEVSYAIDRDPEANEVTGSVAVLRGDDTLAILDCDRGTVQSAGYPLPLFDAKERAGQCWRFESHDWGGC